MEVRQILNNNVAIVNKGSEKNKMNEMIVYSKGVAFKKKVGDRISQNEIQKTYVLDSQDKLEHLSYLLSTTKEEYLQIVTETIEYGQKKLNRTFPDYLYLALLDHIDFAIKRIKKNQFVKSPLIWEVRKFYPNHYKIGLYSVKLINEKTDLEFPEEEAVSIALHFINIQESKDESNNVIQTMEVVKDILAIIKYHYNIEFDEESVNYMRLVTHLQYFAMRIIKGNHYGGNEAVLNKQIQKLYPESFKCVNKIRIYLKDKFQEELMMDEETYLMLHIQRITERVEGEDKNEI